MLTSDGLFQEYKAPPKSPKDAPTQTFDVAGSAMTAVDDPKAKGGKDQKYGFIIRFGTNVEMTQFIERSFHYDTAEERGLWVEEYEKVLKGVHRQSLKVLPDGERSMDREVRDLERQEQKLEIGIKALAKKGDRKSATILVRQLQHCTLHIAIYIS